MQTRIFVFFVFFLCIASCREPYEPYIPNSSLRLLIVEGNINSGIGSTLIKLSRSQALRDNFKTNPERGAIVTVEGEDSSKFQLANSQNGNYSSPQLNLKSQVRYRLHIVFGADEEYRSDYSLPLQTPPIDSLTWIHDSKGVHVFADTHDSKSQINFYRFQYMETWEFHSVAISQLRYIGNGEFALRETESRDSMFYCWKMDSSTSLILGNSTQLSNSKISHLPVADVVQNDEKIAVRYSILVKQYAQSIQGYTFYSTLKKNTELTGSIFSSQPANLAGNIHTVRGDKNAIGFIECSAEQEKRLFISNDQVHGFGFVNDWEYKSGCFIDSVPNIEQRLIQYFPNYGIPLSAKYHGGFISSYNATSPACGDCRFSASHIRPSFW